MAKLTLEVQPQLIAEARRLAKEQGTTVSSMFARFIGYLGRRNNRFTRLGRLTREATGLIRLPQGRNEQKVLEQALMEKYGLKAPRRTKKGPKSR